MPRQSAVGAGYVAGKKKAISSLRSKPEMKIS
jgi:hypothetical protein